MAAAIAIALPARELVSAVVELRVSSLATAPRMAKPLITRSPSPSASILVASLTTGRGIETKLEVLLL